MRSLRKLMISSQLRVSNNWMRHTVNLNTSATRFLNCKGNTPPQNRFKIISKTYLIRSIMKFLNKSSTLLKCKNILSSYAIQTVHPNLVWTVKFQLRLCCQHLFLQVMHNLKPKLRCLMRVSTTRQMVTMLRRLKFFQSYSQSSTSLSIILLTSSMGTNFKSASLTQMKKGSFALETKSISSSMHLIVFKISMLKKENNQMESHEHGTQFRSLDR